MCTASMVGDGKSALLGGLVFLTAYSHTPLTPATMFPIMHIDVHVGDEHNTSIK